MSTLDEYVACMLANPERRKQLGASLARLVLGELLYDAREYKGLTVAEMAAQLGVRPEYLSGLEQGEGNPHIGEIGAWLAALGYQVKMSIEPLEREGRE